MSSQALSIQLVAKNLGKRFRNEWIFKNFDYDFQAGNVYAITGANGSGKSTLLQLLWAQTLPTTGSVSYLLNNQEIEVQSIYQQVAIVGPYLELIEEFTLEELVQFHFKLRKPIEGINVKDIITLLHLNHAALKQIGNFSSGMRQRVKLGLAVLTEKKVLFLDEPYTNLDETSCLWAEDLIKKYPTDLTFIASNDKNEYRHADQIIDMHTFK